MEPYKIALLIIRLFGLVWLIVGTTTAIATFVGLAVFSRLEGVWYFMLQYFIYGLLELLAGLALLALSRPAARLVSRTL